MLGKIEFEDEKIDFYDPNEENLVARASCNEVEIYGNGEHRVVLVDCGVKNNIIRCLLDRDTTVIRVPGIMIFRRKILTEFLFPTDQAILPCAMKR